MVLLESLPVDALFIYDGELYCKMGLDVIVKIRLIKLNNAPTYALVYGATRTLYRNVLVSPIVVS